MSKLLAISWTPELLRYVFAHSDKEGALRVINAGEREIPEIGETEEATKEPQSSENNNRVLSVIAGLLKDLVSELHAGKATLLLCVSRGAVDSVNFPVPPASDAELPTLVRNMAVRQLQGINEESLLDFIAYPPQEDGTRKVSALVVPAVLKQTLEKLVSSANCLSHRILITPHPLRIFATDQTGGTQTATLVISEGADSVHLLITQHQLPVLSRTVRLSSEMSSLQRTQFIVGEVQRTLLAEEIEITDAVLVGSEVETARLIESLQDRYSFEIRQSASVSLIDGNAGGAAFGVFTPLVAALKEEALARTPAIDFAHPRLPPKPVNMRRRILGGVAVLLILAAGGWYYVNSQFSAIQNDINGLKSRRNELNELVKKTRKKRNLAKVLKRWENSRMSWLDELRDLTIRIPSSPELSVQQFSISPTQTGALVSFRGTGRSPEAIRKMEISLSDKYHQLKIPGIRERKQGNKSIWTFQTTMKVQSRSREEYTSHNSEKAVSSSAAAKKQNKSLSQKSASAKGEVEQKPVGGER